MDINTCYEGTLGIRGLALYSHVVPVITTLILAFFSAKSTNKSARLLFFNGFIFIFSLWLLADLATWLFNDYKQVAAWWAPLDLLNILFFSFIFLFIYADFISEKIPHWLYFVLAITILPPLWLTISGQSVHEFDHANCEMIGNDWLALYKLSYELILILGILILGVIKFRQCFGNKREIVRVSLVIGSIISFLLAFSGAEFISTLTAVYEITLYSLFILPICILLLTVALLNYNTFNYRELGPQILLYLFIVLAGSEFFFVSNIQGAAISLITFGVTLSFGVLLYFSSEKEKQAKLKIATLAMDLEAANERLQELDRQKTEFVSIASHQLRAPITAIKGYASLLTEGSYGKIPEKMTTPIATIYESSRLMVNTIEDFLNVSRIELGRMQYAREDFNLVDLTRKVVDELTPNAKTKGLELSFSPTDVDALVNADMNKIKQVISNFVDNAIKYTPKGSITVSLTNDKVKNKTTIAIKDTGQGLSKESIGALFDKFTRARNADKVNTTGTGLGLYVGRQLITGHNGRVWVESEGEGKGSTFFIELPLK